MTRRSWFGGRSRFWGRGRRHCRNWRRCRNRSRRRNRGRGRQRLHRGRCGGSTAAGTALASAQDALSTASGAAATMSLLRLCQFSLRLNALTAFRVTNCLRRPLRASMRALGPPDPPRTATCDLLCFQCRSDERETEIKPLTNFRRKVLTTTDLTSNRVRKFGRRIGHGQGQRFGPSRRRPLPACANPLWPTECRGLPAPQQRRVLRVLR